MNKGKYNLPHICNGVLFNTTRLKTKNQQECQQQQQVQRTSLVSSRISRSYKIADIFPHDLMKALCMIGKGLPTSK